MEGQVFAQRYLIGESPIKGKDAGPVDGQGGDMKKK